MFLCDIWSADKTGLWLRPGEVGQTVKIQTIAGHVGHVSGGGGVELSPDIYRQMFQITYNICKEESHLVERSHDKDKTDSGQRFAHLVILLHIDRVDEFDCKFAQLTTIVPGSAGPICFIGLICLE